MVRLMLVKAQEEFFMLETMEERAVSGIELQHDLSYLPIHSLSSFSSIYSLSSFSSGIELKDESEWIGR